MINLQCKGNSQKSANGATAKFDCRSLWCLISILIKPRLEKPNLERQRKWLRMGNSVTDGKCWAINSSLTCTATVTAAVLYSLFFLSILLGFLVGTNTNRSIMIISRTTPINVYSEYLSKNGYLCSSRKLHKQWVCWNMNTLTNNNHAT